MALSKNDIKNIGIGIINHVKTNYLKKADIQNLEVLNKLSTDEDGKLQFDNNPMDASVSVYPGNKIIKKDDGLYVPDFDVSDLNFEEPTEEEMDLIVESIFGDNQEVNS